LTKEVGLKPLVNHALVAEMKLNFLD